MSKKRKQEVLQSVHRVAPLSQEPVSVMSVWTLVQIVWDSGERTRHLVGRANREGRVCSDIRAFDLKTMTATTRSGRQYRLEGEPGRNRDGFYVFEIWLNRQSPVSVRDMTPALMHLREQRGLPPQWNSARSGSPAKGRTPRTSRSSG